MCVFFLAKVSNHNDLKIAFLERRCRSRPLLTRKKQSHTSSEAINERSAKEKTNLPKKLDQIQVFKEQLYEAEQKEDNRSEYLRLKKDLEDIIASLEKEYSAHYQYNSLRKVPNLATLRKELLNDSIAFLGYFVGDSIIYSLQFTQETHFKCK